MHTIDILYNEEKHKYLLPSTWEEMTGEVWKKIAFHVASNKAFSREVVLQVMETKTMNPWKRRSAKLAIDNLPAWAFYDIYGCLDWLVENSCTYSPFEYIKMGRAKYYMPAPRLQNITIIEYAFLDMAFLLHRHFIEQKDIEKAEEWLVKLCMYMARPIDKRINPNDPDTYRNDRREKFNTTIIDRRLEKFKKLPFHYKFGCLVFFAGCKAYIHQRYKNPLFPSPVDEDGNEIIGVNQGPPQPLQWIQIINSLAGGKFGNLQETRYTNLYDVLEELKYRKQN